MIVRYIYDVNSNTKQKKIIMKKLNGMKGDFSSLENKRLKNLQAISGGAASSRSASSGYNGPDGPVYDVDYYTDAVEGTWKYSRRLSVGSAVSTDPY